MANAYVGTEDGSIVFVLIEDRAVFDKIQWPMSDGRERGKSVLSKSNMQGDCWVIFQYWLKDEVA